MIFLSQTDTKTTWLDTRRCKTCEICRSKEQTDTATTQLKTRMQKCEKWAHAEPKMSHRQTKKLNPKFDTISISAKGREPSMDVVENDKSQNSCSKVCSGQPTDEGHAGQSLPGHCPGTQEIATASSDSVSRTCVGKCAVWTKMNANV